MYLILPGEPGDRDRVAEMIRCRAAWMRQHGLGRWQGWERSADALADQVADPQWPVWVLTSSDGTLLGCTTIDETPRLGWTEQEQAEPALFRQSTVTHPTNLSGCDAVS